jgi:hypothetical protein
MMNPVLKGLGLPFCGKAFLKWDKVTPHLEGGRRHGRSIDFADNAFNQYTTRRHVPNMTRNQKERRHTKPPK